MRAAPVVLLLPHPNVPANPFQLCLNRFGKISLSMPSFPLQTEVSLEPVQRRTVQPFSEFAAYPDRVKSEFRRLVYELRRQWPYFGTKRAVQAEKDRYPLLSELVRYPTTESRLEAMQEHRITCLVVTAP
jgi:hypothetical protein